MVRAASTTRTRSSEDKSITKFKDLAWSSARSRRKLEIDEYPYVIFDEGTEEIRAPHERTQAWQPEGLVLDALREHVDVSTRAMRSKTLDGSIDGGHEVARRPARRAARAR